MEGKGRRGNTYVLTSMKNMLTAMVQGEQTLGVFHCEEDERKKERERPEAAAGAGSAGCGGGGNPKCQETKEMDFPSCQFPYSEGGPGCYIRVRTCT